MGHIAIRIEPVDLTNSDLDLRYRIPALVSEATSGRVRDDGYDYADGDSLVIYLACDHPESDVLDVIETLRANKVCENRLLDCTLIGISTDARKFSVVHPIGTDEEFSVRPW